jgi:hypothetical protein
MEDLIEEIAENTYLIRGSVPVEVVNERLILNLTIVNSLLRR